MKQYLDILLETTDLTQDKPIKDIFYESLRKAVISGAIPVGTRINQKFLSDFLNISRTPIRIAIEQLKKEDLLEEIPNYGIVVKKITARDVEEIFQIRIALETLATINAMDVMQDDEFEEIDQLLRDTMIANENGEVEKVIKQFGEYNRLLFKYARMPRLEMIIGQIKEYLVRFRDVSLYGEPRRSRALFEHILIFHCIKTKEKKIIEMVVKEHLDFSKQFILRQIAESNENYPIPEREGATDDFFG